MFVPFMIILILLSISELGPRDCDCEMSKVKERAMEEEKKDKGEAERVKEGGGGKKKVERLPKPGSPGNPFRCGQGLKCPWVNGEKGPRCGLLHPEPSTGGLTEQSKVNTQVCPGLPQGSYCCTH